MRRKAFFAVLGLGALALLAGSCGKADQAATAQTSAPPVITGVETMTVSYHPSSRWYEATGTVKARLNATMSSKVMSRVVDVAVREGQQVKAGQTLVTLDSRELNSAVRMANANLNAAQVGVGNASTAATMEERTSAARIAQAQEGVNQSRAALGAAESRLQLALAGPRTQERQQARLAVQLAESNLKLARTELDRVTKLVEAGALAGRLQDSAQNAAEVAQAQYESAVQAERIADEGTRQEDIQAAREAVDQAKAAVRQAEANLRQARAGALQTNVRQQEILAARAQTTQASAALNSAKVMLSYSTIAAPFDGVVVSRLVDPGSMAAQGVPLLQVEGGDLRLESVVPESLLGQIRVGTPATARFDALPGRSIQGKVTEIVPQGDASTHSFIVKVSIPKVPGLKSGMFGRARFATGSQAKLTIPTAAMWHREGLNYVHVLNEEGIARLRIITIGETEDDRVEVLSGLADGDQIVTSGLNRVVDGAKVQR